MVYQNTPHHLGSESKELRAVLPVNVFLIDEPQVRLIDQRGRLQSVIWKLLTKAIYRDTPQFLVDERQHLVEGGLIAVAPVDEELSNTRRGGILHQSFFLLPNSLRSGPAKAN